MFDVARIILLSIHLVANALAAGAPAASACLPFSDGARRRLAGLSLVALAAAVLTGGLSVVLVLAGGWPEYAAAAARLPHGAYLMFVGELAFSAGLLGVYYACWDRLVRHRVLHRLIAVVAATNLLYHFPTMMVVLRLLAERPELASEPTLARPVFRETLWRPLPMGLTFHFWALSVLVTGLAARWLGAASAERDRGTSRAGALLALLGVCGLFFSGVWCLVSLPAPSARGLLAPTHAAGWLFAGGVAGGLMLLHRLASEVCGAPPARVSVARDGLLPLALSTVLLMAAASRLV